MPGNKRYYSLRRQHSDSLRSHFDIAFNGIDYHNPFNIGFEFKESYMQKETNIFFKIPQKQVKKADFFIFCNHDKRYYVIPTIDIKKQYSFKNKRNLAHMRINTVKLLSAFETNDINELKEVINNIKEKW